LEPPHAATRCSDDSAASERSFIVFYDMARAYHGTRPHRV